MKHPHTSRCVLDCTLVFLCVFTAAIFALQQASAAVTRDFGVDVSHFQGANGISQSAWNQMYNADGKRFTFVKASEGLTGPDDAAMTNNVNRATAAGFLVGVYHYPHAENRPTTNGAIQEADHFLTYAGTNIGPGRLRPVLDMEGNVIATNFTPAALTDWIIAFSNEIISQRGKGAAPIIYMNRSFARDEVDGRLANYDLWLAYYTNVDVSIAAPPPTASYPNPTGVFLNWCFWQYSSTGSSGGISPLDLDVCHNEYKPLSSFIIPPPSPSFNITGLSQGPGGFHFAFTNIAGTHFTVLRTTDLSLSIGSWTAIGIAVEGPNGTFQFTDPGSTANSISFYRVRSP